YTWLISQNVLEIKAGDKFGIFEVKEANEGYLLLYNKDKQIDLSQNTVQPLYGDLKFKVADKDTALRFYPFVEQTIPAAAKVELKAASATTATTTPAISVPTIAPTASATPSSASTSIQAAAPIVVNTAVQSAAPVKTQEKSPLQELLGFWGFYAILGLATTAYFVLRKKD
ncbi:MAG: S-layer protein domain-containing protein, partial [Candidatus Methanoperedens sp.]